MKHILFVRCWQCGQSVMLGRLGVGVAGVEESALTRVVLAIVDIATRRGARLIEGVCVDCALAQRKADEVSAQRAEAEVSTGADAPAPTQLTLEDCIPGEGGVKCSDEDDVPGA